MKINSKQISAVIALPGKDRYEYFVKRVADTQEVWGLYDQGWALASADDGVPVFPIWPASEYAALSAEKEWGNYQPRVIGIDEFLSVLLPKLEADGVLPGVFFTPASKGVTPSYEELRHDLNVELQKYS